jgi:hypothetical protein
MDGKPGDDTVPLQRVSEDEGLLDRHDSDDNLHERTQPQRTSHDDAGEDREIVLPLYLDSKLEPVSR